LFLASSSPRKLSKKSDVSARNFSRRRNGITGNCSITLLGRTNAAEMAERPYRFLNPDIKVAATRLEKGQLILNLAVFREPVKIKFPMAAYKQPS
jgi:hypothetical protein